MKSILFSYALMLLQCVFIGVIVALMRTYSLWWGFLFLFPMVWVWLPMAILKEEVPIHANFSTKLFLLAFVVWCVVGVAVTIYMRMESFLSIMCIASVYSAWLMTFMSFLYSNNLRKLWYLWNRILI